MSAQRHNRKSKESLLEMIKANFQDIPAPPSDKIIRHDCGECNELRDDLSKYGRLEVPPQVVTYHFADLPLLSPQARRYYLPSFLLHAIETENLGIIESLIFHLYTEDFDDVAGQRYCLTFTKEERSVTCAFLDYVSSVYNDNWSKDDEYLTQASKTWCGRKPRWGKGGHSDFSVGAASEADWVDRIGP